MHIHHPVPIPMEDDLIHTDDQPVCQDPTCPDKTDDDLIAEASQQVAPYVENGLLTPDEATRTVLGRQL